MTVEERLIALEERVISLEQQLRDVHAISLKRHMRCPCGSTDLLHTKKLRTGNDHLALEHGWVLNRGELEAYVCRSCGLLEIHAVNMEHLTVPGKDLTVYAAPVEPTPPVDPYR